MTKGRRGGEGKRVNEGAGTSDKLQGARRELITCVTTLCCSLMQLVSHAIRVEVQSSGAVSELRSCVRAPELCQSPGAASELRSCVRAPELCQSPGAASELRSCVRAPELCQSSGAVSELRSCVRAPEPCQSPGAASKAEVAVLTFPSPHIIKPYGFCGRKAAPFLFTYNSVRAQELCQKSRWPSWPPPSSHNKPYGSCGRKAAPCLFTYLLPGVTHMCNTRL